MNAASLPVYPIFNKGASTSAARPTPAAPKGVVGRAQVKAAPSLVAQTTQDHDFAEAVKNLLVRDVIAFYQKHLQKTTHADPSVWYGSVWNTYAKSEELATHFIIVPSYHAFTKIEEIKNYTCTPIIMAIGHQSTTEFTTLDSTRVAMLSPLSLKLATDIRAFCLEKKTLLNLYNSMDLSDNEADFSKFLDFLYKTQNNKSKRMRK